MKEQWGHFLIGAGSVFNLMPESPPPSAPYTPILGGYDTVSSAWISTGVALYNAMYVLTDKLHAYEQEEGFNVAEIYSTSSEASRPVGNAVGASATNPDASRVA